MWGQVTNDITHYNTMGQVTIGISLLLLCCGQVTIDILHSNAGQVTIGHSILYTKAMALTKKLVPWIG